MKSDFKKKISQMFNENNYATAEAPKEDTSKHIGNSTVRNVCFILLDDSCVFLNYSFLVSGEYNSEGSQILLTFTTHKVTLTGHNIETLYWEFMEHLPKRVICDDERYASIIEKPESIITGMIVELIK